RPDRSVQARAGDARGVRRNRGRSALRRFGSLLVHGARRGGDAARQPVEASRRDQVAADGYGAAADRGRQSRLLLGGDRPPARLARRRNPAVDGRRRNLPADGAGGGGRGYRRRGGAAGGGADRDLGSGEHAYRYP